MQQTLQFDHHISPTYSLAAIRIDYPLLLFKKIYSLDCHVICAIDTAFNLHFIQYRDKLPSDPVLYPPSYALTSHPKILFTIEPIAFFKEVKQKYLTDEEFMGFYTTLDDNWGDEPGICIVPIKSGVILYRPVRGEMVYLLDFTKKDSKLQIMTSLIGADIVSIYNENIIIFSSCRLEAVFMYHRQTEKIKKLNFKESNQWILKSIPERHLCIGTSCDMTEILDVKRNIVIERFAYDSMLNHMIAISPNSTRIVHGYGHGETLDEEFYIEVWDLTKDCRIIRRDNNPLHLNDSIDNRTSIDFLNDDFLIHVKKWEIELIKIEETGIVKLQSFHAMSDQGFLRKIKYDDDDSTWPFLSLVVTGPKNFLLLTSDVDEDAVNRIEYFEIDIQGDPTVADDATSNCKEKEKNRKIVWNPSRLDGNFANDMSLMTILNTKVKQVFLEKVDKINAVCSWQSEKVGLLYESNRFYEYDLRIGKYCKLMSISGVKYNHFEFLKKIYYANADHLVLHYEKDLLRRRLIVIDLKSQKTILDTKDFVFQQVMWADVSEEYIVLSYRKDYTEDGFIGTFNLKTKRLDELMKLEAGKKLDRVWSLGNHLIAGRYKNSNHTLVIWNLENKELVLEKRFVSLFEKKNEEVDSTYVTFWDVTRLNDELICLVIKGIFSKNSSAVIYNWRKDNIVAKSEIRIGVIFGIMNNELYVQFDEFYGNTFYSTLSLGEVLHHQDGKKIKTLKYTPFAKCFLGLSKSTFEVLSNKKNAVLVMKQCFPNYLFIMRKRNKQVEILRHLKREIANYYHPYLIQEVTKIITG